MLQTHVLHVFVPPRCDDTDRRASVAALTERSSVFPYCNNFFRTLVNVELSSLLVSSCFGGWDIPKRTYLTSAFSLWAVCVLKHLCRVLIHLSTFQFQFRMVIKGSGSALKQKQKQKKTNIPFRCKICSVSYSSKTAVKRHVSTVHREAAIDAGGDTDMLIEELDKGDMPSTSQQQQSTPGAPVHFKIFNWLIF